MTTRRTVYLIGWQHPDDAPEHTSVMLYVPWDDGQPFIGEGFLDWNGVWRWASDREVERPVKAWKHLPKPPRTLPISLGLGHDHD